MTRFLPSLAFLLLLTASTHAQPVRNLLRNGDLQDDWLTQLPENKNHHWCYSSELYNRRDFNPDGWFCRGSWQWLNADAPAGERRLVLEGPSAVATQRVNWVLVHDSKKMGNMADAGGFPQIEAQRSLVAERLMRDLTFRVRLKGQDVSANAGVIELAWCPPGSIALNDPLGSVTPPTTLASLPLPEGTFGAQWLEVTLPAAQWLQTARDAAAKNPKEAAVVAKSGLVVPGTASVAIRFKAAKGRVELEHAELLLKSVAPNLLAGGDFEAQPHGWSGPAKYRHFPGRLYYLFNTWHNAAFDNRGQVQQDSLIACNGNRSLQMIVPAGDELAMTSAPIILKQSEPRLLEVTAMVKTDRLAVLHIDAVDEYGDRLDAFPFIHMAPHSIGTNDWRLIRQVFRPRRPVQELRLMLCARGTNGFTLDDTGYQPQNNVVGTIWWDDVKCNEPESTREELAARGVKFADEKPGNGGVQLDNLDLGERLLGENILRGAVQNSTSSPLAVSLQWQFTSPSGKASSYKSAPQKIAAGARGVFQIPYEVSELCTAPYTEYRGELRVLNEKEQPIKSTELWFATWNVPIDIDLGALYLRPEQKQFVRMNFGLAAALLKKLATVRFEVNRRSDGKTLTTEDVSATTAVMAAQRDKLPIGLRDDFANVLLADLDVSALPLQPFNDPQRNWFLRVSARDSQGKVIGAADSQPFCRLGHDTPQPPAQSVKIEKERLYVNDQPWMPWGVIYGHVPVYDGPADPGKYLDLHNVGGYSIYDRYGGAAYTRALNDFNCLRYVAASISDPKRMTDVWTKDNLMASSAFVVPSPAFSMDELLKLAGGKEKLDAYLAFCKTAPMVVSTAPGIEEAFGLFHSITPEQLKGLEEVVKYCRQQTGKPVMISHGGYWNRLEFERATFYDIFDPETEPLYPANLHTDLQPLVHGKDKAIWLRPQMYEDVPYERWRFHVFVELMRGCRGWQIAHGPGDQSLFRGLHAEMEFMKPIIYSQEPAPETTIEPQIEHTVRQYKGKTYIIAATTRGIAFGKWRAGPASDDSLRPSRMTAAQSLLLSETNSYGADQKVDAGPSIHGVQYLPHARNWPEGTKLVQQVRIDAKESPDNLILFAKTDGRWTHAASWGKFDAQSWLNDPQKALWFLRSFYRHAYGFLGWGTNLVDQAKPYMPAATIPMGPVPESGKWLQIEVPLDRIGAANGLLDGIGFAHEGGRVYWGRTSLLSPEGVETVIWGDSLEHDPAELADVKIQVVGLRKNAKVRVLFEDRELNSGDGHFTDDFRGADLYQRYGGGYGVGYGSGPVALHVYEIDSP